MLPGAKCTSGVSKHTSSTCSNTAPARKEFGLGYFWSILGSGKGNRFVLCGKDTKLSPDKGALRGIFHRVLMIWGATQSLTLCTISGIPSLSFCSTLSAASSPESSTQWDLSWSKMSKSQLPTSSHICYCLLEIIACYLHLFLHGFPRGDKQQKPKMRLQICIHDTQPFLQSQQIVTPSFRILWKLDRSLIMQEAKL